MRKKLLPGNAKNAKVVELPALIALKGVNRSWFTQAHFNDIFSIILVWEMISGCDVTRELRDLMIEVERKRIIEGQYSFSEADARRLQELVPQIVDFVVRTPNNLVDRAIQQLSDAL